MFRTEYEGAGVETRREAGREALIHRTPLGGLTTLPRSTDETRRPCMTMVCSMAKIIAKHDDGVQQRVPKESGLSAGELLQRDRG